MIRLFQLCAVTLRLSPLIGPLGVHGSVDCCASCSFIFAPPDRRCCGNSVRMSCLSVILCRLYSESSSQALSVFNKANLLDLVVRCLERHSQNVELAISAGGRHVNVCLTVLITDAAVAHVNGPLFTRMWLPTVSRLSPAHCLHTATDDNPELLCSLNAAAPGVLENVLLSSQQSLTHTLLRSLAAGVSHVKLIQ